MKKIGVLFALLLFAGCNEEAIRQPPPAALPAAQAPAPDAAAAQAEALKNALTVDPVDAIAPDGRVVVRLRLKNPTAKELRPVLSWEAQGTWWQGEKATMSPVAPGGEGTIEVQAKIGERVFPLPRARLEVTDGKQKLCGWEFLGRAMAAVAPMVREWNVAGPFEAATIEKAAGEIDGKSVRWQVLKADPAGLVNLGDLYQAPYAAACAVAYIYSSEARAFRFSAGSTDSLRVRINGKEVWTKQIVRNAAADQDAFSADLAEGWNEVLVKVAHREGPWGFYFRVIDPQRQLKFALKPAVALGP